MALSDAAKEDGLPEEVIAEVEGAESGATGDEQPGEQRETIRLSRRKKEQVERDERMSALERRAAEADKLREEIQRGREETAQMRGALEQLSRAQVAPRTDTSSRADAEEPIDRRIAKQRKKAEEALAKSDLGEYHERMERIMELKAQALIAAQPRPAAPVQQQQAPQKPDWVRAIEFQYPDVLTHPRGQFTAGQLEPLIDGAFGPEKLHKMFAKAREHLGLKAPAAPATNGQRQLYSGITSNGTGPRQTGERVVNVPREYLATAARMGMSKAEAAKAWADSYPNGE